MHARAILVALFLATALCLPAFADDAPAPAGGDVVINFSTTGSVIVDFTFKHKADGQHFCALTTKGWAHAVAGDGPVEVTPTPPSYELRYDAGERRAAQHFHLLAFGYRHGVTSHSDPANDWIDFWADGDEWLGHGDDPAFKIEINFGPDGHSGTFKAKHLRAARDGKVSPGSDFVDVKGDWQCPLGAMAPADSSSQ